MTSCRNEAQTNTSHIQNRFFWANEMLWCFSDALMLIFFQTDERLILKCDEIQNGAVRFCFIFYTKLPPKINTTFKMKCSNRKTKFRLISQISFSTIIFGCSYTKLNLIVFPCLLNAKNLLTWVFFFWIESNKILSCFWSRNLEIRNRTHEWEIASDWLITGIAKMMWKKNSNDWAPFWTATK